MTMGSMRDPSNVSTAVRIDGIRVFVVVVACDADARADAYDDVEDTISPRADVYDAWFVHASSSRDASGRAAYR